MKQLIPRKNNTTIYISEKGLITTENILKVEKSDEWFNKGIKNEPINNEYAIYCFDKALFYNNKYTNAYFRLAYCLSKSELTNEIRESINYGLSILLDNNNYANWETLQEKVNLSSEEISELIDVLSNRATETGSILKGYLFCLNEKWLDALSVFEKVTAFKNKDEMFYFFKGLAKFSLGNYSGSIKSFEFALEIQPDFSVALYFIGICYKKQLNYNESNKYFDLAFISNENIIIDNKKVTIKKFYFLKNLAEKHPNLIINCLAKYHPIDAELIYYFSPTLGLNAFGVSISFGFIGENKNIIWTEELVRSYVSKWMFSSNWDWNWVYALKTNDVQWCKELVLKEEDKAAEIDEGGKSETEIFKIASTIENDNPLFWKQFIEEYFTHRNGGLFGWNTISMMTVIPWSIELIDRHKNDLNWFYLSGNTAVKWSDELIDKYKILINWEELSFNSSIVWSEDLLVKFGDFWDWEGVSYADELPWSIDFIDRYKEKWNWDALSLNPHLPWSEDLIDKYIGHRNSKLLDLGKECFHDYGDNGEFHMKDGIYYPSDLIRIHQYSETWDWYGLCKNKGISWKFKIINKYIEHIDWESLSGNNNFKWNYETLLKIQTDYVVFRDISSSEDFPWNINTLGKFFDNLNKDCWNRISSNKGVDWSIELLTKFKKNLNWNTISQNTNFPWSNEIIYEFIEELNWSIISNKQTNNFPWTIELLVELEDKLDWEGPNRNNEKYKYNHDSGLSGNEYLPWSEELIEKFKDKWNWGVSYRNEELTDERDENWLKNNLSKLKNIPWNDSLLEKYEDYWFFEDLSKNEAIPWSIELLEKYKDRLDYYYLSENKNLYERVLSRLNENQINKLLEVAIENQKKKDLTTY